MRYVKVFLVVFVTAVTLVFLSQNSVSFADDDIRLFDFFQIKYKIDDRLDIFIQPDIRSRDDIGELYYYHFRNGIVLHAFENLDLGATYRYLDNKNSSGSWKREDRLELDITPKIKRGALKLANRSRFEYRALDDSRDRWRYRNLTKIAHPVKINNFEFTSYVTEEIFYDFEIEKMHLNWATIGADKKMTENLLVGLFYRNEATRVGTRDEWDTNHVIGTKAVLSL